MAGLHHPINSRFRVKRNKRVKKDQQGDQQGDVKGGSVLETLLSCKFYSRDGDVGLLGLFCNLAGPAIEPEFSTISSGTTVDNFSCCRILSYPPLRGGES